MPTTRPWELVIFDGDGVLVDREPMWHRRFTAALDEIEAAGMPCCVVSSGDSDTLRTTLGLVGVLPRFDGRIFSATAGASGAPQPDLFLDAAARMGASPRWCAVVDDTPVGTRAAIVAGMTVFGYAERSDRAELTNAGAIVFDDIGELPGLLEWYGVRTTK